MNIIDLAIGWINPRAGIRRAQARQILAAYDSAEVSRLRKKTAENRGPNKSTEKAIKPLREQARYLEQNHDLVVGVIDTAVNNVIGPRGITIEPQPRTRNGDIHKEFAEEITDVLANFDKCPEVSHEYDRAGMERQAFLTYYRDGEVFAQHLLGRVAGLDHCTTVPYSLELIEPDFVPLDLDNAAERVVQGIQRDQWGRPAAYYFYSEHPGDTYSYKSTTLAKRVEADFVIHLKNARRIQQVRGVTALAPVMTRLLDIKDYEESERVAARIAAAMAVYIKRGSPDQYGEGEIDPTDPENDDRLFEIAPGMIWDKLRVGEDVGTIQSNRPSNLLQPFRDAMLKAVAAGTGTGFSSISKSYDGTYSAQRQELVEQYVNYSTQTAHFIHQFTRPIYEQMVAVYQLSRGGELPADLDLATLFDAEYRGPVMPWIDPQKEVKANEIQVQAGFKSRSQVIRERGGNPASVVNEITRERMKDEERGLIFSTDFANHAAAADDVVDAAETETTDGQAAE